MRFVTHVLRIAFGSAVLVALVAGATAAYSFWQYDKPGKLAKETTLIIARGSGFVAVADQLAQAGVVRDRHISLLPALLRQEHTKIQAGEYAFAPGASPQEVMRKLISGEVVVHSVTIPEGLTVAQVAALLEKEEALTGAFPEGLAEGTLLPDTIHFTRGMKRAQIVASMQEASRKALAEAWAARAEGLPITTPEEALVLASIVERETGLPEERAKVAGVYINRLRIGMRLQADPTVQYGIEAAQGAPLGRPLTSADLQVDTPYNTYTRDGLPPGPIANPGVASIRAALNPEATDALYFVATGTGGHRFAATLAGHNANVSAYRKALREQESGSP